MRVYILLFNPRTDNEGIHALQVGDRRCVLMFEDADDAERFALLLEAQDFPMPGVEEFDSEEIEDFCAAAGYDAQTVPTGELFLPPEQSLDEHEWSPDGSPSDRTERPESRDEELPDLDEVRRRLEKLL
ncbi:protein of unknown function (DUF3110) [Rubidibacter lacunae KORDI 51-2]|uniref:DUF3110 domain-containing protein n=1 Tax=Rubidibacter lacunae KORDI 51-2 TaxID=582515 RepID=U5D5P9_9CHRO|nr:DUF3110 domain-containing protein [Rubidibacter lacunae]ERN39993.1 protein of unknown function (DUF3110) [Rubidibacter lacunae KORDI 51-2]